MARGKINVSNTVVIPSAESTVQYLKDIKKKGSLSLAQEQELIKSADTASRNKLIEANLKFVIQVANKYRGMGLELEDLIGFGNVGLFEAAEKFDTSKNLKFITFAVWYIRAEIQKALNDLSRVVRVPSHLTATAEYSTKSISTPVGDGDNKETYADRYLAAESSKSGRDKTDLQYDLARALSQLKPKQKEAVCRFYGVGFEYEQCMDQIAEEMGVTGERARQLVRQAENALKALPGIKLLEQYK
jgi:RNA polymerase sigma factor (sigma-70 family)